MQQLFYLDSYSSSGCFFSHLIRTGCIDLCAPVEEGNVFNNDLSNIFVALGECFLMDISQIEVEHLFLVVASSWS